SRQGFKFEGDAINFDYITGSLMAKLYLQQGINFEVGPWLSYLLAVNPNSTVMDENTISLSDLKGGKDAGIAVGIGFDFKSGLMVGARYQLGLSDMAGNLPWQNRVIAISLGWKF
ncbi:MAG: PorT family protein, partial [Lentimicrobiaceae bacterium]|nr:PorT family protein [Lentimicrobiaceae bacterium]